MTKAAVRAFLLVVFIATMASTGYLFWKADSQALIGSTAAAAFDAAAADAQADVTDLRAAQQAYVAAGQGPEFWFARTTALVNDIRTKVAALRLEASAPSAAAALDDVNGIVQDFEQMDRRAREFTRSRQLLLASDLIFSDGVETTRKLADAIGQARTAQRAAGEGIVAAEQRRQVYSFGAAIAGATLIVLLLLPAGRREVVPEVIASVRTPEKPPFAAPAADLSLDVESWSTAKPSTSTAKPDAPEPAPLAEPVPVIDLQAVATVCGELARLTDTQALPGVLGRASQLLDAQGIILWIADPDGNELAPIVTHGYPQNLVTRLGTIRRDADNATAAALRTGLLQTVKGDAVSNGAIAAPLVTGSGCVGVLAAEVRHEGERQDAIIATAGIIASQIATLVGPPVRPKAAEAAG